MKLYIDNKCLDVCLDNQLAWTLSIDQMRSLDPSTATLVRQIRVPATPKNRDILLHSEQIFSIDDFNSKIHIGRIEVDQVNVLQGIVVIRHFTASPAGAGGVYLLELCAETKEWVKNASTALFKDFPIIYETTLNANVIASSWNLVSNQPFKFFPVARDRYDFRFDITQGIPARVFYVTDYHPFMNIRMGLESIVAASGYKLQSEFLNSGFFNSLYMSGNYPTQDVSMIQNRNAFNAGRLSEVSTFVSSKGLVFMNPDRVGGNTIGNIVESASSIDNPLFFNINNGFQRLGGKVVYVPTESANIGFEYELKYKCTCKILNARELSGMNVIQLDDGMKYNFTIPNTILRYNNSTHFKGNYTLVCDDVSTSERMIRLKIEYELNQAVPEFDYLTINSLHTNLSFSYFVYRVILQYKDSGQSSYIDFDPLLENWALYPTSSMSGDTIVHVKLRSNATSRKAGVPIYFDTMVINNGYPNTVFTLLSGTMVRPIFWSYPGVGSKINTSQLMAHDGEYQIKLFDAIRHMFNLYYYTNPITKTIFMEPRDKFYNSTVVDWCHKQDLVKPMVIEHSASKLSRTMTLLYKDGDGQVARDNERFKRKFARHRTVIDNYAAKQGQQQFYNPLFTPTMGNASVATSAQAAYVIHVGDRLRYRQPNDADLDFPAKIVRYVGLRTLPSGQYWPWPTGQAQYPFVAFHYNGTAGLARDPNHNSVECHDPDKLIANGLTLCFNDLDDQKGLHQFYDKTFTIANRGRLIHAYIYLSPTDIESLSNPVDGGYDFRSLYKIKVSGEDVYGRLIEVKDYDPLHKRSSECVFFMGNGASQ